MEGFCQLKKKKIMRRSRKQENRSSNFSIVASRLPEGDIIKVGCLPHCLELADLMGWELQLARHPTVIAFAAS